jgi:hypothetical protein
MVAYLYPKDQCSVLFCSSYTNPSYTPRRNQWVSHLYAFADDTQLYLHCKPTTTSAAVTILERCLEAIRHRVGANRLKLNTNKKEVVWLGYRGPLGKLSGIAQTLAVGDDVIQPNSFARLLEVTVTSDLSMEKHVSTVCARCLYQLRQLRCVCQSLDDTRWVIPRLQH